MKKLSVCLLVLMAAIAAFMPAAWAAEDADPTKGEKVVIKIAHVSQAGVPIDVASNKLGEDLSKKTDGRITVQVFPASALGNNTELLEQLQMGTLEMAISSVAFLGAFTDSTKLLDLPYLFESDAAAEEVLDGPVGQKIFSQLEPSGFKGLAWLATGWRHVTSNTEVRKPEDMQGQKIRVMENQMHIDHFNALGASAVPMAFSELYTALQNKTMDAEENPFANIDGNRLYEVQKYIIKTGHIYDTSPLLASKVWWDKLSKADQELIQGCVNDMLKFERKLSAENEAELEAKIGSNGKNVIITLTPEERAAFKNAAKPVYDKYGPQIGEDLIKQVEEVNKKYK
ncbi:TRAP transporter substrate-binding protein [Cloacibacillus sp. An23]|uniref:TRAP transporter substrate-binding protein n=1 Tax=Cloacibacillus sp. An23 TaxID=1965591 RepID=UPI000B393B2E|nr:TRAP transporter substrate-binding protein [Cloacibacillus sp. An23]OUO92642.1 TRAP transporter substrate-binding protein DctP [Cloacibacillus sp. An23]